MILYSSQTSPYVRKVRVLLLETGQGDSVEEIPSSTSPNAPTAGLVAKNPLMKIPALERPDGPTLYDSRVICQYLDARSGGKLYPEGSRLWDTLTLEATADGMLDAALLMTYEMRLRPEENRWDEWSNSQWSKIEAACAALTTRWLSHLSGPLDMGQIAVGCALAYADFRHGDRDWRGANSALAAWYEEFSKRPSMLATVPPQ